MGLLSSAGQSISGLLGKEIMGIPAGAFLGIPQSKEHLQAMIIGPEKMAERERLKRQAELEQMQIEAARMQMDQARKSQQKDDITSAMIQSMNAQLSDAMARYEAASRAGQVAQQAGDTQGVAAAKEAMQKAQSEYEAIKSPAAQNLFRGHVATQGNPEMAMQAGLISPIQQEQATSKMREYEFARQNGYTGSFTDFMQLRSSAGRDPYYTVVPTTQGLMRFNSATGEMTPVGETPLVRPSDDPATQRALAEGKTSGKLTATSDADALSALPKIEASAVEMDRLLTELVNHPGKSYAVGTSSVMPVVPGTDAAGFMSRLDQIRGEAFLQAYERLRGGGAITQIEGEKGEQAIARLSRAQSEEEFDQAVADLQDVIAVGLARARRRAAQAQNRPPMSPVPGSSPAQNPADARLEELRQKYGM